MSKLLTRTYRRPKTIRLRVFMSDPTTMTRYAMWTSGEMYRYRHNKRSRAAHLLDFYMQRSRG